LFLIFFCAFLPLLILVSAVFSLFFFLAASQLVSFSLGGNGSTYWLLFFSAEDGVWCAFSSFRAAPSQLRLTGSLQPRRCHSQPPSPSRSP